jgi:hypothetical protein
MRFRASASRAISTEFRFRDPESPGAQANSDRDERRSRPDLAEADRAPPRASPFSAKLRVSQGFGTGIRAEQRDHCVTRQGKRADGDAGRLEFRSLLVRAFPSFFARPRPVDQLLVWIPDGSMDSYRYAPGPSAGAVERLLMDLLKLLCLARPDPKSDEGVDHWRPLHAVGAPT